MAGTLSVAEYARTNIGCAACQAARNSTSLLIGTPPPLPIPVQSSPKWDWVSWEVPREVISKKPAVASSRSQAFIIASASSRAGR